jgi:hypothetical protein
MAYSNSISAVSSTTPQEADANTRFPLNLQARVVTADTDNGVPGATVSFFVEKYQTGSPQVPREQGGNTTWWDSTTAPTDENGFAQVAVLAGSTEGRFRVLAQEQHCAAPAEFFLTVRDNATTHVTALDVVSGDGQIAWLGAPPVFAPLKVKALDNAQPVDRANVTFVSGATDTDFADTRTKATSQLTAGGGYASANLRAGVTPEVFQVTASCNGHSRTFHLALGPAFADLKLVALPKQTLTSHASAIPSVTLSDIHSARHWPYAAVRLELTGPFHFGPDEHVKELDVVLDDKGMLPAREIFPDSSAPVGATGSITYLVPVGTQWLSAVTNLSLVV